MERTLGRGRIVCTAKMNADISDTFNKCLLAAAVAASFEQMLTLFNLLFCCLLPLSSKRSCRVCLACCSRSRPRRRFCFYFFPRNFLFILPSAVAHSYAARLRKPYLHHLYFSRIMNLCAETVHSSRLVELNSLAWHSSSCRGGNESQCTHAYVAFGENKKERTKSCKTRSRLDYP